MHRLVPSNLMLALVAVGTVVSVFTLLKGRRRATRGFRLPPGPVPLPLVGNIFSIDPVRPWITYTKWKAHYGDIFMIRVLKQDIIVINSAKIARDLLERRSSIYSDRPYIATRIPYGWDFMFAFTPYGNQWRTQKRIFHQAFRAEAIHAFYPVQLKKAQQLVLDLLSTPHDYSVHIQRFAAAIIMSIVYDYDVSPHHDHLVEIFERGIVLAMEGLTPETASIVEAFPFVLSLPEWLPGGAFGRKARVSRQCAIQMIEEPFKHARNREAMGSTSVALDLLKRIKDVDDPSQLQLIKETCASAFIAGAETSSSTLMYFMLAMVLNPKVQERAYAEIDAVVGTDRFPTIDDRPSLPYVEAILMETLRMYTVVPLGVAHAATADDTYGEFFIPKGCTVVANVWAMYRDETTNPEPDTFKPERFFVDGTLNEDMKFIDNHAFGFGRRMCSGRHAADSSVWAAVVSILWAFKITKALNEQGEEIDFEPTFRYGVTTAPHPFPCSITPRRGIQDIQLCCTQDSAGVVVQEQC